MENMLLNKENVINKEMLFFLRDNILEVKFDFEYRDGKIYLSESKYVVVNKCLFKNGKIYAESHLLDEIMPGVPKCQDDNIAVSNFEYGIRVMYNYDQDDIDYSDMVTIADSYISTSAKFTQVIERFQSNNPQYDYFKIGDPTHIVETKSSTTDEFEFFNTSYTAVISFPATKGTPIVRIYNTGDYEFIPCDIYNSKALFNNVESPRKINTVETKHTECYKNIKPMSPMSKYDYAEKLIGKEYVRLNNEGEVECYISPNGIAKTSSKGNVHSITLDPAKNLPLDETLDEFIEILRLEECTKEEKETLLDKYSELKDEEFIDTLFGYMFDQASSIIMVDDNFIFYNAIANIENNDNIIMNIAQYKYSSASSEYLIKIYMYDKYIYACCYVDNSKILMRTLYDTKLGKFILSCNYLMYDMSKKHSVSEILDFGQISIIIKGRNHHHEMVIYSDPTIKITYLYDFNDGKVVKIVDFDSPIYSVESGIYLRDEFGVPYKLQFADNFQEL